MKKYLLPIIFSLIIIACARVGSPEGGEKDILPPVFLKSNIDTSLVNIPINTRELKLYFDEYINLKEVSQNLTISPPIKKIKKILPSNLANKYILIQWDEDLQENTTYNFNFGNSIVDYNEGNVLPYFNFAFSTGNHIDSLYISGNVTDVMLTPKKTPKNGIVIGLYKDSMDIKQKPYYITKADDDGYFEINHIAEGEYNIIAFEDENQNSIFDIGKEKIGFVKDKIKLSNSISGQNLKIYPSKKNIRYKEFKPITGGVLLIFEGNPSNLGIKSLNDELSDYRISHTPKSDSAIIYIGKENNLNKNISNSIKLSYINDDKKDTISISYKINEKDELSISNNKGHLLPPKKDFIISANMDIKEINTKNWTLTSDSINIHNFEAKISEKNPKNIIISSDFKEGKSYSLNIPKESIESFYHSLEKTYIFNFQIDKSENYGSLVLRLNNPPNSYFWVQLLDQNGDIKYSQYTKNQEIKFTEIIPTTYHARILVDNNNNNFWDYTDFVKQVQAEDIYTFQKELEIKRLWEIVEDWTLE